MADIEIAVGAGMRKKFKDMGDGTFAEVVYAAGVGGGGGGGGDASAANQLTEIGKLDAVIAGLAALAGYTDGLEGFAGLLNGYVDGLEGLTSAMSAKLPATLGIKTAAASLSVAPASDAQFALTSTGAAVQAAIVRPNNANQYAANDVFGGVLTFAAIGPTAGTLIINTADFRYDVAALPSGMVGMRLYLYSATPPSAYADNAAWDLPAGDRSVFLGFIDIGTPADLGSTLFVQADGVGKELKLGAGETSLYGYLVTLGSFTPGAVSETAAVRLAAVAV